MYSKDRRTLQENSLHVDKKFILFLANTVIQFVEIVLNSSRLKVKFKFRKYNDLS